MIYLKWFLCLPVFFASTLFAYIMAPIAVLARREYSLKGTPFWWITTPNTDLRGDPDHQEKWHHANSYLQFLTWIWRNPAVNFQRETLGVHVESTDFVEKDGNWQFVWRDGVKIAWMYYLVKPYGSTGKGLRVLLGWKVWDAKVKDPLQMTCRITPWKSM
jgi:hypothetical protein